MLVAVRQLVGHPLWCKSTPPAAAAAAAATAAAAAAAAAAAGAAAIAGALAAAVAPAVAPAAVTYRLWASGIKGLPAEFFSYHNCWHLAPRPATLVAYNTQIKLISNVLVS